MDLALEPGCPDRRAHPRWMQQQPYLRDAVASRSHPQAPPAKRNRNTQLLAPADGPQNGIP